MAFEVAFSEDPARVLNDAKKFLASDPVPHNLIRTLLQARVAHPEPGRYWVAYDGDAAAGVAFQSPLDFTASVTPMSPEAVEAMVAAISDAGAELPGVMGEAATAARFAGQWTERHKSAAVPVDGQRIYEVREVLPGHPAGGALRQAVHADRDLVLDWLHRFQDEAGSTGNPEPVLDERLAAGQFWLWDDGGPGGLAAHTEPVNGVVRVSAVYTPPENRNRGYAGALVGGLSARLLEAGYRCILYTDLGNPTSNSVYRRIGYRAVAEVLRYRFG